MLILKKSQLPLEALRLNIPIFAIVDTNCDPDPINYVIPANDDAVRTVELISKVMSDAIIEGTQKHKEIKAEEAAEKEREKKEKEAVLSEKKEKRHRVRRVKFDAKGEKKDVPEKAETAKKEKAKETINNDTAEKAGTKTEPKVEAKPEETSKDDNKGTTPTENNNTEENK